jgi:electron transfer flavoprotein alpha subunit
VPETVEQNLDGCTIKRDNVLGRINPADMFAIEETVRFKERFNAKSIGLCMGILSAENALKNAIALGLDSVYLLSDKIFVGSDTYATSYILSKGIELIGNFDLILCGRQSTDGDTGQVGQEIASHLNIPCLINVVSIELIECNRIRCKVLAENGYIILEVALPAVVCVLKGINEPRVPTISGLMKASAAKIKVMDSNSLAVDKSKCGLIGSPTRIKKIKRQNFETKMPIDIGNNYQYTINKLIDNIKVKTQEEITDDNVTQTDLQLDISNTVKEIWVVCEIVSEKIADVSLELLSKSFELAYSSKSLVAAVLIGKDVQKHFETVVAYGASKIYCVDNNEIDTLFNESYPNTLVKACQEYKPSVLLLGSTIWGRWLAPNVSVKLSTGLTADCMGLQIDVESGNLIQTRVAFGGNIIADIICPNSRPQMATVRSNIFPKKLQKNRTQCEMIDIGHLLVRENRILTITHNLDIQGECLSNANIVIAGGKGVGSKENFELLFRLAKLIGGDVAATRYAVDAGWIDYSYQVGQTGISVRPKVYLAFGISGAIEHIIGMRDSDCIISVNTDLNASIFAVSDYKIIDNCMNVINNLLCHFEANKNIKG